MLPFKPIIHSQVFEEGILLYRVTVKVENMRKQPKETLPHLCAQQQIGALMRGSNLGANKWALAWKIKPS